MEAMIADILVKGVILTAILYVVARHEADLDFEKAAMVVAGITLGTFVINVAFIQFSEVDSVGSFVLVGLVKFLLSAAFVVFMLMKFCWVRLGKAILAMLLFYVFNFAMTLGIGFVMSRISKSVDEAGGTMMSRYDQNTQEALSMFKEMMGNMPDAEAEPEPVPLPDAALPSAVGTQEAVQVVAPPVASATVYKVEALTKKEAAMARSGLRGSRDMLKVTATMTDPEGVRHAVVNGRVVEEGGIVEVEYDLKTYRWKIAEVRPEGVIWESAEP